MLLAVMHNVNGCNYFIAATFLECLLVFTMLLNLSKGASVFIMQIEWSIVISCTSLEVLIT